MPTRRSNEWGRIDLFHNNAAIVGPQSSLLDFRMADFDRIFAVNVRGVLLGMQAVGRIMRAQGGGSIVNTSSVSGQRSSRADAGLGVYGASKAAVIRMTQQAALEFAPHKIRINVICPGPIDTPLLRSTFRIDGRTEEQVERGAEAALRESAAGACGDGGRRSRTWCSGCWAPLASIITGGIYNVDGGMTALKPRGPTRHDAVDTPSLHRDEIPVLHLQQHAAVARIAPCVDAPRAVSHHHRHLVELRPVRRGSSCDPVSGRRSCTACTATWPSA